MWIIALFIWTMMLGARTTAAFECAGVALPSSIVICSDPELMRLADERQEAINEARGRIGEDQFPQLWDDQKAWVRSYATACSVPPDRPPPSPVPASIKVCFNQAAIARIAYIRAYGGGAGAPMQPSPGVEARNRVGPSFDCDKAVAPLALMICADPPLSLLDLRFNQAYWALYQQLGPAGQPQLKEEDLAFINQVQEQCAVPMSGPLTAEVWRSRNCVSNAYERIRQAWVARLTGPAREEGVRAPEAHIALQQALQELGFGPPRPADGVYGRLTRAAIFAWQSARGRAATGFLGDADATALKGEISPQTVARVNPQPPPSEEPAPVIRAPKLTGAGTAFAINSTGEFLTNYHVVKGCSSVRLGAASVPQNGTVVFSDERNDLALVRTSVAGIQPLRFREGKGIRPADGVVALGFPYAGLLATSPQVTTGSVSALAGVHDDSRMLQLTAPIQPGNSGGPLLDLSGNVVGIVSARLNELAIAEATGTLPQNINFAIKSTSITDFLDAHRIDYSVAKSDAKLDPADVGEKAMKSTVMLQCYE